MDNCVSTEFTSCGNMTAIRDYVKSKPDGYMSLSDAFPRLRSSGNITYTRVSRNGYLNFRRRKFTFPLSNRYKNGNGNTLFHPVITEK